jgi:hypothetical protein
MLECPFGLRDATSHTYRLQLFRNIDELGSKWVHHACNTVLTKSGIFI